MNSEPKKYNLDKDQKLLQENYESKPDFRVIQIYDKFFIQYKTKRINSYDFDELDEIVFYDKLLDDYYFDNINGFDSFEAAQESLLRYLNAPLHKKIYGIDVSLTKKENEITGIDGVN